MKIIVNGVEVIPCKKEKLTDHLPNLNILGLLGDAKNGLK